MAAPKAKVSTENVDLGFAEETEKFLLKSRFFPSKLGGWPAWLSLESLPNPEGLACQVCSKPTSFLLQVYSPDCCQEDAFHRTIFIFVCSNPKCNKPNCSDNFLVFRSQLPKVNKFYSAEPPKETIVENEVDAASFNKLCQVCGCLGPKTCSKCHSVNYCSREHQTLDWKAVHKRLCNRAEVQDASEVVKYPCSFPEMELVTEAENYLPNENTADKSEDEKMKEYSEFMNSQLESEGLKDLSEAELQKMASEETDNVKQLRKFKKRLSHEPEQVLRYNKGGEPLWIAHSPKPEHIPDCSCGSKRQFEFQVLPHLLSMMDVDNLGESLDWGVLCIYTCIKNCSIGNNYHGEYIYKQDVV